MRHSSRVGPARREKWWIESPLPVCRPQAHFKSVIGGSADKTMLKLWSSGAAVGGAAGAGPSSSAVLVPPATPAGQIEAESEVKAEKEPTCDHCRARRQGEGGMRLKHCSGCKIAKYCSDACNRLAWKTHKAALRSSRDKSGQQSCACS